MARNRKMQALMVILLSPLLLSALLGSQSITSSAGRPQLFWVAADKTQCSNYSNGSDCDTLDEYLGREDVNFSLSDTTWTFLHGEHVVRKQINIIMARNITLRGEERCAENVRRCTLNMHFDGTGLEHILIWKSEQITIQHLAFKTKEQHTRGELQVKSTRDFCVNHVHFLPHTSKMIISNPLGDVILARSIFAKRLDFITILDSCPHLGENCAVAFTVVQCTFKCGTDRSVQMTLTEHHNYRSLAVNVTNTTFSKCGFKADVISYPTAGYSMELNVVRFEEGNTGFHLSAPLKIQGQNKSDFNISLPRAKTSFHNCRFYNVSGSSIYISLSSMLCAGLKNFMSAKYNNHDITIFNSHFEGSQHTKTKPFTVSIQVQGKPCSAYNRIVQHQPNTLLILKQTTFNNTVYLRPSKFEECKLAALFLKNLQGYRVVMAGENQIVSSKGYGLMLENSQVELHGYNEISESNYTLKGSMRHDGGGIYMSSDSQLLLSDNSHLNVSANTGNLYGGGIYVSYAGLLTPTLTDFVDCYIERYTCPGWCFFQFINSDGQYVNASAIAEHNATVILSHNTATLGGNNVFNGHFQNCSLQTAQGTLPASIDLISTVFCQHPPVDKEVIPSYPYFICLCDGDELNCIRNHTLVIDTYPVQQFPISVIVKADWQQVISVTFKVIHESETMLISKQQMDITGCTKVYALEHPEPGSSHRISLGVSNIHGDGVLDRELMVKVFNSCSPGLVYKKHMHGCACNAFLMHHKFRCIVITNAITYKTKRSNYWIGMRGKELIFSPNCPSSYCKPHTLLDGLTLNDSTQNQQCQNGRQGLLCSECPSGYSSLFGSYECKKCSSVWLLQIPVEAIAGIFIVALLFLFNLTLLQGTIMGVVLYANITGLMEDFLQEHAWSPLFFLLSVLNFRTGGGRCFYDGMDQFAKALFQFAFPFYLFTLLIVIIIVTHKCGYRMFRKARFIARRAVPVLATIMVLTYTSLVSAVITPLRYTTLYDADTAQGKTVWLYQPSLPFFRGQHLVLGILSIAVIVFYLIPFTFTMLFGDLMRRYFHKLWFSHFMDVLHGGFRWPLGFWIGLRLLLRVILAAINIFTYADFNTAAYCTFFTVGTLLVLQLLVKPFRDPEGFRKSVNLRVPQSLGSLSMCKRRVVNFLNTHHVPLFDLLYLLNVQAISATVIFGTNAKSQVQKILSKAGVNILILLALVQFAVILVYHAYNFFPVPERARSCAQSCWSTIRAIPSMLKDTQCCRRGPREEEEPRRSPIPILILRPPEIDESYDSESETSSCSEQPLPEEVEVIESSLQEPLLIDCD